MFEDIHGSVRAIHELERAIHLWEMLRDNAQQVVDETTACSGKHGEPVETNPAVVKARAYVDTCNASILATKARIDELVRGN
jgi:hypothetical protein